MKLSKAIAAYKDNAQLRDSYWVERAKLQFSIQLEDCRRAAKLTFKGMAERIGTSGAYLTKVFRGDSNLTIESMVKLARATGGELKIEIKHPAFARQKAEGWAKFGQIAPTHPGASWMKGQSSRVEAANGIHIAQARYGS